MAKSNFLRNNYNMGNFNARLQLIVVALFLAVIPSLADNVAQGVCGTG